MLKTQLAVVALLLAALMGCNRGDQTQEVDTPTTGTINLAVDETFMPLADAQLQAFHGLYKRARINVAYKAETEIIQDLQNDSVRAIMISRLLTPQELEVFDVLKLRVRSLKIAVDGVAIVMHPDNPIDGLTVTQLRDILSGSINTWNEIDADAGPGQVMVVFDNPNSSTVRYLSDSLLKNMPLTPNAFAAKTNPEVVNYVAQQRNAIGVIGLSWISDADDTLSTAFLNKIKVAALKDDRPGKLGEFAKPYQAYLTPAGDKLYPLRRDVYILSREARSGLATGFASFASSERGQRIVLKSGLLPATMPIRLVEFGDPRRLGNKPTTR